jgi:predicted GIY-YIG superfamily endonuclease
MTRQTAQPLRPLTQAAYRSLEIHVIYALVDPRNNSVRYVGYTRNALPARLSQHLRQAKHRAGKGYSYHTINWVNELVSVGLRPEIVPLETHVTDWAARERFWIWLMRDRLGCELTNTRDGGGGGAIRPPSPLQGRTLSQETRNKISEAAKRRYQNPEERSALSERMTGRTVSAETRAKLTKTHCPQDHEYTPENTVFYKNKTGKECRTCRRIRGRETAKARRAKTVTTPQTMQDMANAAKVAGR